MGPDGYGGECMGCGNQEHFVNCADIAIGSKPVTPLPLLPEDTSSSAAPSPVDAGPAYHVHHTPAVSNSNNYEVNMASLVKQIYNSIATGVQNLQTSTPSWTGTSFSQPTPKAPQWNSPPAQQNNLWQSNSVSSLLGDSFNWQVTAGASPTMDFGGYDNGEYPEIGELHAHNPGAGTTYLRGYNDALNQMHETFGFPPMGVKTSPAFNEVSLSLQEAQKGAVGTSFASPMLAAKTCADGAEMECRASNPMFSLEFDSFCQNACSMGQCQSDMCTCTCPGSHHTWSGPASPQAFGAGAGSNCRSVDRAKAGSMDRWCTLNCRQNNCPSNLCVCG